MQEHKDTDLVFYLQVYHDRKLAEWCLGNIRRHYPDSRIMVVSDGDPDPEYVPMTEKFRAEYHLGERLYPWQNGGLMLDRMFELYMLKPARFLLKFDTDTGMHRRFRYLPDERLAWFGTRNTPKGESPLSWIQGGFVGFPHDTAELLYQTEIFRFESLKDYMATWAVFDMLVEKRVHELGLMSFEFVLRWGCEQLGIPTLQFDEVNSRFREPVPNDDLRYAVVHPYKEGNLKGTR